jgi:hypothetical protein
MLSILVGSDLTEAVHVHLVSAGSVDWPIGTTYRLHELADFSLRVDADLLGVGGSRLDSVSFVSADGVAPRIYVPDGPVGDLRDERIKFDIAIVQQGGDIVVTISTTLLPFGYRQAGQPGSGSDLLVSTSTMGLASLQYQELVLQSWTE